MIFVRQLFTDAGIEAVPLSIRTPIDLSVHFNLLARMKDFDPVLFGGCMRDAVAGVPVSDYDMCLANDSTKYPLDLSTPDDWDRRAAEERAELEKEKQSLGWGGDFEYLNKKIAKIKMFDEYIDDWRRHGFDDEEAYGFIGKSPWHGLHWQKKDALLDWLEECGVKEPGNPNGLVYSHISMLSVQGKLENQDCDFVFANSNQRNPQTLAILGDAPINCVAMGADGVIWAHSDFEKDLAEQHYRLRVKGDQALSRGKHGINL